MKGDVKRNTSPSGDSPDQRKSRGSQPQLGYGETDVPAFEELQYISDIVRKTISNWDDYGRP